MKNNMNCFNKTINQKYFKDIVADAVGPHACTPCLHIAVPKAEVQLPLFAFFSPLRSFNGSQRISILVWVTSLQMTEDADISVFQIPLTSSLRLDTSEAPIYYTGSAGFQTSLSSVTHSGYLLDSITFHSLSASLWLFSTSY